MTDWDDNCGAMKNFGNCLEALDFNRFPGPSSLAGCGDRDAYPHIPNECLGEGGKGVASRRSLLCSSLRGNHHQHQSRR